MDNIKNYEKEEKGKVYTYIEQDFVDYTFVLCDKLFFEIHKAGKLILWFNTIASRKAISIFKDMLETDYKDFGDLFYTYREGIWRVYAHSKEYPSTIENSELVLEMDSKQWFSKIIAFLEKYQYQKGSIQKE